MRANLIGGNAAAGVLCPAGFLLSGDVQIEAGARSKTINIKGVSSYTVTASTSWGASANATEIAQDHFVVEFSSPAPPARPAATPTSAAGAIQTATPTAAAITPTPVPLTGQLHWLAFRYP